MSAVTTADMPNGGVKHINDYILTIQFKTKKPRYTT